MAHAFDVQPGDTMYWVSDIGWMMGPWELFGMTLLGGTAVLYDGALDYPGPDRLWALVERHRVNILGVSPTLIRSLMQHGDEPVRAHDLSSLRILGSTGEPWNPEPWRWLFDVAGGGRLPIINYSGGTEVSGGLRRRQRAHAAQAGGLRRPAARHRRRRRGRPGPPGAQPGRRAGRARAVDRHDARLLARPGALRGDLLVALPRRVGARRLGRDRRRRPLVHPRPLRRHDQDRRQAARARRRSSRCSSSIRRCSRPRRSACPTS